MSYVADVCEIEEVVVVADLEFGLAFAVGGYHFGEKLDVAFAEDAGGADGAG